MIPDLDGKWTGELIYDESFGRLANEILFFVMEIRRKGDEFKGTSVDIDGVGINPSEAMIKGFLEEKHINFVKEYKTIEKTEFNSVVFNPSNKKGAEITFSGFFNAETGAFEGEWVSLSDFMSYNNDVPGSFRGGSWTMRKDT